MDRLGGEVHRSCPRERDAHCGLIQVRLRSRILLVFSHDTSGIDFDLVPIPTFTNSISGAVVDSAHKGVPSHVLLGDRSGNPWSAATRHIFYRATDSLGNYQFDHLPEGNYAVLAIPIAHYAPAWYDADSCGVLRWSAADIVHVVGNVSGIDICVKTLRTAGVGEIAGTVYQAPKNGSAAGGPGISGTVVCALSPGTNQVLGFDVTDIDGSYSIQNLPAGVFDIAADKEGYLPAAPLQYTLDAANNYAVARASIGLSPLITLGVGPGKGGIPREFALGQNYPNPFNPTTTISYVIGQPSLTTLKVYDILGRVVATLVNEVKAPGSYRVSWDAADYPSGVYTYRVQAGKFADVKKMILMR
ncbi:MAG: T9SS type A sorting domain-containing protein [Ignavibacteria bacterium]|nr:MAG: T9SS type A sorting domain-containing protein [Ignavibacteria bacterium]